MITFNETLHLYLDGVTQIPSVTQILSEVYGTGLEGAPKVFVNRAADKGTKFHKEVHEYLTTGKQGTTEEFNTWHEWFSFYERSIVSYESEKIVYAATPSGSFAGTLDFLANGFIKDWKTSKTATRKQLEKWQMQLSMYIYAARQMGYAINEPAQIIRVNGTDFEIIHVDYLGDEWVENTVKMYYEGQKVESKPETSLQTVDEQTLAHFGDVLKQIAELEKSIEPICEHIKAEMEKRKILELKAGNVSVTYVSPTTREMFDTKRFKAENVDLYKQYTKTSEVKSSIRIKLGE